MSENRPVVRVRDLRMCDGDIDVRHGQFAGLGTLTLVTVLRRLTAVLGGSALWFELRSPPIRRGWTLNAWNAWNAGWPLAHGPPTDAGRDTVRSDPEHTSGT